MKKALILFSLLAILLFISSCKKEHMMVILEYDAVQLNIEEMSSPPALMLEIKGRNRNSGLVVEKIRTIEEGSSLTIYVFQTLPKKGYSGDFLYTLSVPESVNRILFGSKKVEIWTRKK